MMQTLRKNYLCFEKWHEEFDKFCPNTRKSQNLHFNELLLIKVYNACVKNIEELCIMTLKGDAIFKEKLIGGLKNDVRNVINFHASSRKVWKFALRWVVLSKSYKVLDEKVRKSYVSWHWGVIQRKANSCEMSIFSVMQ